MTHHSGTAKPVFVVRIGISFMLVNAAAERAVRLLTHSFACIRRAVCWHSNGHFLLEKLLVSYVGEKWHKSKSYHRKSGNEKHLLSFSAGHLHVSMSCVL